MPTRSGFTLVELSIVLVIIGLITGGILAGQSLIRAAELKAVTTEYNKYFTATQAFRDKYQSIPGDMNNATQFWGFAGTTNAPNCVSNSGITAITATGTCDGNGDGTINIPAAGGKTGEMFQFWRQLASAGLVEGTYTGVAGGQGTLHHIMGTNSPHSKLTNAGWEVENLTSITNNGAFYNGDYGNTFIFGGQVTNWDLVAAIIKPEEAWNIDTKVDDGKPNSGKVLAIEYGTCATTAAGGTATFSDPVSDIYKLTDSGADCGLVFAKSF